MLERFDLLDKVTLLGAGSHLNCYQRCTIKWACTVNLAHILPRAYTSIWKLLTRRSTQITSPTIRTRTTTTAASTRNRRRTSTTASTKIDVNGGCNGEHKKTSNAQDNAQNDVHAEDNAQEQEGRFSYSEIHDYLASQKYPIGFSKADKLALRKRSKLYRYRIGRALR